MTEGCRSCRISEFDDGILSSSEQILGGGGGGLERLQGLHNSIDAPHHMSERDLLPYPNVNVGIHGWAMEPWSSDTKLSRVGDRSWIGWGNTAELELELIKDRGHGPAGAVEPCSAPHRRDRGYKRGNACSKILMPMTPVELLLIILYRCRADLLTN
jgi:hypothetical protein